MGLDLRTSLEHAKTVKTTNTGSAVSAGNFFTVSDVVGVVVEDAATSEEVVIIYQAEKIVLPKAVGAVSTGQKIFYDAANSNITTVATANTLVGICTAAAASADTTIEIDFDPMSFL